MHMTKVPSLFLVLLCCKLSASIKVPIDWDESAKSEVKDNRNEEPPVGPLRATSPHVTRQPSKKIKVEYFEYPAEKPMFASDIAEFHGVQNPKQHYKSYPIVPYTLKQKPVFGVHQMLVKSTPVFDQFQDYVHQNEELKFKNYLKPTAINYEVFHPYTAEMPALKAIYKDPVLMKIKDDLQGAKKRLQAYEEETAKPNIAEDEYLETPEETDVKLLPQKNIPVQYEIHKPERRPLYYKLPYRDATREHVLNQRLKHPFNQFAKVRPLHYHPVKNHINQLRQQHALKYDDERNEYPQVTKSENFGEPPEGYDIYEKGKQKYTQLRDNLDESVNRIVQQNREKTFQNLELQKPEPESEDEPDEFIPVKNYAQVRKTETYRHLPKQAAYDDAETYEEIRNAPRLREAVKSTKAQTVYSEEGYEDSAYDHAGEQKHASDHEGHGGFLKEHQNSGGLYKIPSVSQKYKDGAGSEFRDNVEHGKKWKNDNEDTDEEIEEEDYSEDDQEENVDAHIRERHGPELGNRNKRQHASEADVDDNRDINSKNSADQDNSNGDNSDDSDNGSDKDSENQKIKQASAPLPQENSTNDQHEVGKREINFKVPEININSTLSFENDMMKLLKVIEGPKKENIQEKYPYYNKRLKGINKNSPLRYAENLKFIPKKSDGGTEFYDSRSKIECSEVDEEVDPIPEKLKKGENPTDEDEDENEDDDKKSDTKSGKGDDIAKKQPRLKGLGDKIDCFKAKYFGENPLDSPFFQEEKIANPEPILKPRLPTYKISKVKGDTQLSGQESKLNHVINPSEKIQNIEKTDIFVLLDKIRSKRVNKTDDNSKDLLHTPQSGITEDDKNSNVYTDILKNIQHSLAHLNNSKDSSNTTYDFFKNEEEVTTLPPKLRKKRATPFVYEPYKIIRDSQVQDSKKTTTTSNISPLIKQLQSSKVAERVSRSNRDDKQAKQKSNSRTYVDIGKKDRAKPARNENETSDATFIDVSVDNRRGEPKYELRPSNHKPEYTPVENKRSMSADAYKSQTTTEKKKETTTQKPLRGRQRFRITQTTAAPYYDVTQFIPKTRDIQNVAASNSVKKTSVAPEKADDLAHTEDYSGEDYDDEDEEEDDEEDITVTIPTTTTTTTTTTTITTTTTPKPSFRRRTKIERTKEKTATEKEPEHTTEMQRLKLVTRFRNYKPEEHTEAQEVKLRPQIKHDEITVPKYTEKKKKTQTSTLVTDTKKYGEDDQDDMKKEVDALIGIKQNMDEYMPMYEKENHTNRSKKYKKSEMEEDYENDNDNDSDRGNDNDDDDEEETDEDYEREIDDEDEDDFEEDENDDEEDQKHKKPEIVTLQSTTPEPTKRTLIRTTDAPPSTTSTPVRTTTTVRTTTPVSPSRRVMLGHRPIITRKKIEIHNELPVNKSSPHVTQFKEDIKEVEIIKEIPMKKQKHDTNIMSVLDLYKDEELAKAINNLGDVEIFRENLDIDGGPKHGGNYRKATKEDLRLLKPTESSTDAETSQSKSTKHVELDDYRPTRLHGGNLKSLSDINRSTTSGRSSKLVELSEPPTRGMHGGNLKYETKRRGNRKSEKLIEIDDEHDEDHSSQQDDGYKPHNAGREKLHGGNYKSAKLVTPQDTDDDIRVKSLSKTTRGSAAELLNSFAQAVPILTSTPGYILDPSKRMYYYVDK